MTTARARGWRPRLGYWSKECVAIRVASARYPVPARRRRRPNGSSSAHRRPPHPPLDEVAEAAFASGPRPEEQLRLDALALGDPRPVPGLHDVDAVVQRGGGRPFAGRLRRDDLDARGL